VSGDGDMSDMPTFNNSSSDVNELNNYTYTEIGELKSDAAEEISEIIWRVDSKIREIIRTSSSVKENQKFEYDAVNLVFATTKSFLDMKSAADAQHHEKQLNNATKPSGQ
jgi:hypothetical protein